MAAPQVARLTSEDLLNRGLPQAAVATATDGLTSTFSGSAMLDALRKASLGLGSDAVSATLISTISAFRTPLEAATYFINTKYTSLGGATGFLGSPTTSVTASSDGEGFFRHFNGGSIYWHIAVGAHEVHGAIRDKWSSLGSERSFLGYPATDESQGQDLSHRGRFNHFQGGSIFSYGSGSVRVLTPVTTVVSRAAASSSVATTGKLASATPISLRAMNTRPAAVDMSVVSGISIANTGGAFEVHGDIHAKYMAMGAEASILGYPTTDESGTPDGIGRFNHFQAGSIYWTPDTGPYEVHGLIRQFWAANGWERNPNLGYPISDELIPDRRIGHRRPEMRRKPIANLPSDVVKLPAEALNLGFAPTVVNVPQTPMAMSVRRAVTPGAAAGSTSSRTVLTPISGVVLSPVTGLNLGPASTLGPVLSLNRFQDFENGVVFWNRGDTAAKPLTAWAAAADGTNMHLSANDVIAAAGPKIQASLAQLSGVSLAGNTFAGTTNYSFDRISVHNRRHRVSVMLMGTRMQTGFVSIPIPVPIAFEVQVEVCFEPTERSVRAFFADWNATSVPTDLIANPPLIQQLHTALDSLLWTSFDLLQIEDTNAGAPIAVLSVKTMSNGDVNIYIEP